jgi:uncharacterized protein YcaQ
VQVDSIATVVRAHEQIVFSRNQTFACPSQSYGPRLNAEGLMMTLWPGALISPARIRDGARIPGSSRGP